MIIQEAGEMYLETILVLHKRLGQVRSIDIVNEMGVSKPTVSEQMKKFRENGYIEMDSDGLITLTGKGLGIAECIYERHVVIRKILMSLGVDEATATADACKIEHAISDKSFQCMKAHYLKEKS
jgi:DtxR family Mn-dependent transcriptional regulator